MQKAGPCEIFRAEPLRRFKRRLAAKQRGGEVRASELPQERHVQVNGVELAYFEWHRERCGRAAPVLLAHATGFHARIWDQMIRRHLAERYVVAVDQRGHGRSQKMEITHWRVFGQDLAALVCALDLRGVVGVGHSMGGHAMTGAAAACPDRFGKLVLIDPVIVSPRDYRDGARLLSGVGDWLHPIAKRKNRFASAEEMFERFRNRKPYAGFDPLVLRDHCEYGLLPAPDRDGYVLACPPAIEASIYMTSRTNGAVYESARALEMPVMILRARGSPRKGDVMDFTSSPTWPGLVHEFRNGREVHLTERTHFVPMEDPALVARYLA